MTVGTNYDYSVSTVQSRASDSSSRDSVDFLTLLIAQLTNQDPLSPMEDTDFTSQLAQLQSLEEQISLNETMTAMRLDTQVQSATSMIGKEVTGLDAYGSAVTGTVTGVTQASGEVLIELANGQTLPVGNVMQISGGDATQGTDLATSANAIGMWIEAGYNSAMQPIQGIVSEVGMVDGQVALTLYGGETVTWSQVESMRAPTDDEVWYTLPDSVREKVEAAQSMLGYAVTGQNESGETISGIVANAELNGSSVYLLLFDGSRVDIDTVDGDAFLPNAELVLQSLEGYRVTGLDETGNQVEGVVTGAQDREDGVVVLFEGGGHLYYDSITELTAPEE